MTYKSNMKNNFQSIIKAKTIKTSKIKILMVLFFLFSGVTSTAQVSPPGGGQNDEAPPPPNPPGGGDVNDEVPISSFVTIGLIAGAAYGIRKLR